LLKLIAYTFNLTAVNGVACYLCTMASSNHSYLEIKGQKLVKE